MEIESTEYEEDLHLDADAVDVRKIFCEDQARPVFTAGSAVTLSFVVFLKKAVGNPQIHFEVRGKVRVQYEGRILDASSQSTGGLRKSKRRKVREKVIFILPVVLSPGMYSCILIEIRQSECDYLRSRDGLTLPT